MVKNFNDEKCTKLCDNCKNPRNKVEAQEDVILLIRAIKESREKFKAKEIVNNIKQGVLAPIYFLMGEEAFYIDAISNYIEKTVLDESEKGFSTIHNSMTPIKLKLISYFF